MPDLAIFLPSLSGGGAEREAINLSAWLVERGYSVDLVLGKRDADYTVPDGVRVVDLGGKRVFACTMPLARYLRAEKPSALLSTLGHANIVAVWAKFLARGKSRIAVREVTTISQLVRNSPYRQDRLLTVLIPLFYRFADALCANSEHGADDLARFGKLKRTRIQVIYNPSVTPELLRQKDLPAAHPFFNDGSGQPVILGVGRLAGEKDFSTLIRAFAQVQSVRPARLLILGEGDQRAALEGLTRSLGLESAVSLPGWESNPYAAMARAAVFVLPSRFEGLPNVLIEAMACGAPCVGTDSPGGTAEILDHGRYGALVPMGDVDAMAQAILTQLEDPTPPELLRQRAADFTSEAVLPAYVDWLGLKRR